MEGHLERLRKAEIEAVRGWLKPGLRVLDVGGGSGYQASIMAALGCDVSSIDIADRPSPRTPYYPVQDYDGRNIPFADASFDLVFSSNVLEHIQPLPPILGETRRVLKVDGLAVHVVPSSVWRFWTSITHYGYLLKRLAIMARRRRVPTAGINGLPLDEAIRRRGLAQALQRTLLPTQPHGEYPNALAELYYFSRRRWLRVLEGNGFSVVQVTGNGLFYTGYELFPDLPLQVRRRAARVLGSACHIFVLEPGPAGTVPGDGRTR